MSTFKRYTNNKGQIIVDFQGTLHEETTNTQFHLYDGSNVTTMNNEDYNKPENKTKFEKNKPFWLAKVVVAESEAINYLKANFNTELYNGKVNFKCLKRKYMPSVFPPMFFNAQGDKIDGVIAKGSYVNIRAVEEEYTMRDRTTGKPVTAKKLTLLGVSVLEDNASTGVQEVVAVDAGSDVTEVMKTIELLREELRLSRNENAKIKKGVDAIVDGMIEHHKELLSEFKNLRQELTETKTEVAELKAEVVELKEKTCQPVESSLQCNQEELTTEEIAEQLPDSLEEVAFNEALEECNYDDEIPF